jgi:hypothetical protein
MALANGSLNQAPSTGGGGDPSFEPSLSRGVVYHQDPFFNWGLLLWQLI